MSKGVAVWVASCLAAVVALAGAPDQALAQQEEGPGTRVVSITTFEVPIQHRSTVMPFIRKYFVPSSQLNPHVLNYRLMMHNWGGNGAEIVILSEYAELSHLEAECGAPCEEYFEANPWPEEGDEGYEDYQKAQELFQTYYSNHRDEIYSSPMVVAKVEGENVGTVGMPEPEDAGGQ